MTRLVLPLALLLCACDSAPSPSAGDGSGPPEDAADLASDTTSDASDADAPDADSPDADVVPGDVPDGSEVEVDAPDLEDADVDPTDASETAVAVPESLAFRVVQETAEGALMNAYFDGERFWVPGGQPATSTLVGSRVLYWVEDGEVRLIDTPNGPMLNWAHGVGDVVWLVGEKGKALKYVDGELAAEHQTSTNTTLWGCWVTGPDEVVAVGGNPRDPASVPVIVRYDGESWTTVELPPAAVASRALFKIWGAADGRLFAVGAGGLAWNFDGELWREVSSGTTVDLISLWGNDAGALVAVGGRENGVVVRWNGEAWVPTVQERRPGFTGSWMDHEGNLLISGMTGKIWRLAAGSAEVTQLESATTTMLHGAASDGRGKFVAVGGTLDRTPPFSGVLLLAP